MNDELLKKIKENDLTIEEWLKTRVTEEYEKALMNKIDELQSNWNSLREWLEKQSNSMIPKVGIPDIVFRPIINKMNELEGKDKE